MLKKRLCHAILPAALLSLAVGQIYAFTLIVHHVVDKFQVPHASVQFIFSLAIFFLGMSAAFFGKLVEQNIKASTILGTFLFLGGMCLSKLAINLDSLILLYLGYGVMVGIGTGITYISPVKTMMLWFPKRRGLASAVPIISFGLGASLFTLIHTWLSNYMPTLEMFSVVNCIYAVMMVSGIWLLRKPTEEELRELNQQTEENKHPVLKDHTNSKDKLEIRKVLKTKMFWRLWLFMFLNIAAGLCIIPLAKQIMESCKLEISIITAVLVGTGVMNGLGRYIYASYSDKLSRRVTILLFISGIALISSLVGSYTAMTVAVAILILSSCYGACFSVLPAIVYEYFGSASASTIHGLLLSAWGVAGLIGNQVGLACFSNYGVNGLILLLIVVHSINYLNADSIVSLTKARRRI